MATERVVALTSGWFGINAESVLVLEGKVFDKSDPVVKKYPDHFGPQETTEGVRVSRAPSALGEKRDD